MRRDENELRCRIAERMGALALGAGGGGVANGLGRGGGDGNCTGPGGCALGILRSGWMGGTSRKTGCQFVYDGMWLAAGRASDGASGGRCVVDDSAGSSASIQRNSTRPSSDCAVIRFTRAGGGD